MLEFKSLHLNNFGPFKGKQSLEFQSKPGVCVVYGQNGRGKTTLLNAIRYVLYGYFIARGSKKLDFDKVINTDAFAMQDYEFSVSLTFEFEKHQYELTRIARPKDLSKDVEKHVDYIQEHFLKKDGIIIPSADTDRILEQIMPEQVSRFFLFDGELLQEYEELVAEESSEGRRIKESIERILGLPMLTNARADMRKLQQDAQSQEAKSAQADKNTREAGNLLAMKTEEREKQKEELDRLEGDLIKLKRHKQQLFLELKKNKDALILLEEKDQIEISIDTLRNKKAIKHERIRELMANSWQWMLNTKLEQTVAECDKEYKTLSIKDARQKISKDLIETLSKAIEEKVCPTCDQDITESTVEILKVKLGEKGSDFSENEKLRLEFLESVRKNANKIISDSKRSSVIELLHDINDISVEIADYEERIKEIKEDVKGINEEKTRKTNSKHDNAIKEIAILEQGIDDQRKTTQGVDKDIGKLTEQLRKLGGKDMEKDKFRTELYEQLYQLFDRGVDKYRDDLRDRIQNDASDLFRSLTTEPEYAGLKINENYGLTIVRKNGDDVFVRSAGNEHIVALSLMGALQKNAPFRGPIIMDSPFGRLDDEHAPNVVRTLPDMAKQVVLLVFRKELPPKLAREQLGNKLISEYQLTRVSSSHTELEKYTG